MDVARLQPAKSTVKRCRETWDSGLQWDAGAFTEMFGPPERFWALLSWSVSVQPSCSAENLPVCRKEYLPSCSAEKNRYLSVSFVVHDEHSFTGLQIRALKF